MQTYVVIHSAALTAAHTIKPLTPTIIPFVNPLQYISFKTSTPPRSDQPSPTFTSHSPTHSTDLHILNSARSLSLPQTFISSQVLATNSPAHVDAATIRQEKEGRNLLTSRRESGGVMAERERSNNQAYGWTNLSTLEAFDTMTPDLPKPTILSYI